MVNLSEPYHWSNILMTVKCECEWGWVGVGVEGEGGGGVWYLLDSSEPEDELHLV